MRPRYLSMVFLMALVLVNCQNKEIKQEDPTRVTDTLKIKLSRVRPVSILAAEASEKIGGVAGFEKISAAVKELRKCRIGQVKDKIPDWLEAIALFREELPDSLSAPAIDARTLLLLTHGSMLKQEVDKHIVDTACINAEAIAFYNAYQDLGIQLNYKYGQSVEDLLDEFRAEGDGMRIEAAQDSQEKTTATPSTPGPTRRSKIDTPLTREDQKLNDTLQ